VVEQKEVVGQTFFGTGYGEKSRECNPALGRKRREKQVATMLHRLSGCIQHQKALGLTSFSNPGPAGAKKRAGRFKFWRDKKVNRPTF